MPNWFWWIAERAAQTALCVLEMAGGAIDGAQLAEHAGGFLMLRSVGLLMQLQAFFESGQRVIGAAVFKTRDAQAVNAARHPHGIGMRERSFDANAFLRGLLRRGEISLRDEDVGQGVQAQQVSGVIGNFGGDLDADAEGALGLLQLTVFALGLGELQAETNAFGRGEMLLIGLGDGHLEIMDGFGEGAGFEQTLAFGAVPVTVHRPGRDARGPHGGPLP